MPTMIIGTFREDENGVLVGTIPGLTGSVLVRIEPVEKKSDKSPDRAVTANGAELGVAWKKTSEKGNEYMSVRLPRSPFLPQELNCPLFKQSNGWHHLVWEDKPAAAKPAEAQAA